MDSNDPSDRKKPTPLEETAWFQIGFADRPVIELARELRSVAEPLEIPPPGAVALPRKLMVPTTGSSPSIHR
jgi:hypothetical protein